MEIILLDNIRKDKPRLNSCSRLSLLPGFYTRQAEQNQNDCRDDLNYAATLPANLLLLRTMHRVVPILLLH